MGARIPFERLDLMWVASYVAVGLLGLRLLHVQVIRNVYYAEVAERNRTQIIYQTAPRGRIYDRRGAPLATSQPAFSLIYLPREKKDPALLAGLADNLARELHREREELLERLREATEEESAIRLAENLPLQTMFKLSELKTVYPGVDLIVEARRYYPYGDFAGHLLGYMGKMDKRGWRKLREHGYRIDSWIGKVGLEELFERDLRGIDGEIRMEVDAQGRLKRKLGKADWTPGANLYLTLDAAVQKAVEEAIRASPSGAGGAVVMDIRDGSVLALASLPCFDPNLFLLPEWDAAKAKIRDFPAFNLALSGTFPPGSTFKPIVGAAMFNENKVRPSDRVYCPGSFRLGNRVFKCWEPKGHHYADWLLGITQSCDVYFYNMGLRTGGPIIEEYERRFHLGQITGIEIGTEKRGNVFGPKGRSARSRGWYDGDTVNLSIGQGELLVTPMQMAVAMAAIASRGTLWKPHILDRVEYTDGRVVQLSTPAATGRVELRPEVWDLLHKGLHNVVKEGTGRRVDIKGLTVYGKTGTAQNPHGEDHAWFVAFAGRENEEPSIAVSVLVQHGGHGSSGAGPVARKALEAAFGL
jgi:penicillin-binding protein 2